VGSRFVALSPADGLMLAEVVEGTVSVAHAVAYCRAIEDLSSTVVPVGAELVRLVHLEIERVVNHLDSMIRHTEGSYQVVANARLATHKERLMRLRAAMCSNRFGRGVVVPGGVSGPLRIPPSDARRQLSGIARAVAADLSALMATPSFLDRLRAAGVLLAELVAGHGGLGPVGRGSGLVDDTRSSRPYGAYRTLGFAPAAGREEGDALARQRVRVAELDESFRLVDAALGSLQGMDGCRWREEPGEPADGIALSAVEAPQGELLYLVEVDHGALVAVKPRCAAFHNFALFPRAFRGDILTDFVFIEASFGLSIAGVAG
jgi:Ni,Fe-hydrogenase III large subunit